MYPFMQLHVYRWFDGFLSWMVNGSGCCLCLLETANCTGPLHCDRKADIVLALDRSRVNRSEWNYALQYLADISARFEIGPEKTQIGVVSFSDLAYVEFYLNNHTNQSSVADAIEKINYQNRRGYYNFARALRTVRIEMFNSTNGARAGACKILVMVAFCKGIHQKTVMTIAEAWATRSTGVKVIMVGLASNSTCSRYTLPLIASRPKNETIFWFTSPRGIMSTCNDVADGACEMAKRCVPDANTTTTPTTTSTYTTTTSTSTTTL